MKRRVPSVIPAIAAANAAQAIANHEPNIATRKNRRSVPLAGGLAAAAGLAGAGGDEGAGATAVARLAGEGLLGSFASAMVTPSPRVRLRTLEVLSWLVAVLFTLRTRCVN